MHASVFLVILCIGAATPREVMGGQDNFESFVFHTTPEAQDCVANG